MADRQPGDRFLNEKLRDLVVIFGARRVGEQLGVVLVEDGMRAMADQPDTWQPKPVQGLFPRSKEQQARVDADRTGRSPALFPPRGSAA